MGRTAAVVEVEFTTWTSDGILWHLPFKVCGREACEVGDGRRGMISDQDAYRTANVLIKRYGADSRSVIFP
jgi:hypothetical protein